MNRHVFVLPVVLALLLAGCGSDDSQTVAPKAAGRGAKSDNGVYSDPRRDPLGAMPVTVSANALTLGTSIGPNGAVVARTSSFTAADTVNVSFPTANRPAGAPVTVFWTYQDGRTHYQERGPLAPGEFAHYAFSAANGMKPGKYNVEVQVANRPIGISDFVVQ